MIHATVAVLCIDLPLGSAAGHNTVHPGVAVAEATAWALSIATERPTSVEHDRDSGYARL